MTMKNKSVESDVQKLASGPLKDVIDKLNSLKGTPNLPPEDLAVIESLRQRAVDLHQDTAAATKK